MNYDTARYNIFRAIPAHLFRNDIVQFLRICTKRTQKENYNYLFENSLHEQNVLSLAYYANNWILTSKSNLRCSNLMIRRWCKVFTELSLWINESFVRGGWRYQKKNYTICSYIYIAWLSTTFCMLRSCLIDLVLSKTKSWTTSNGWSEDSTKSKRCFNVFCKTEGGRRSDACTSLVEIVLQNYRTIW